MSAAAVALTTLALYAVIVLGGLAGVWLIERIVVTIERRWERRQEARQRAAREAHGVYDVIPPLVQCTASQLGCRCAMPVGHRGDRPHVHIAYSDSYDVITWDDRDPDSVRVQPPPPARLAG